jgi:hypothetical protein
MRYETCNVVMLPSTTEVRSSPEPEFYIKALSMYAPHRRGYILTCNSYSNGQLVPNAQHLYICSSEKIKLGDWYYNPATSIFGKPHVEKCGYEHEAVACMDEPVCSKIIATSNPALKLPGIPEQFLEDYAKAPVDQVDVAYTTEWQGGGSDYRRGGVPVAKPWISSENFLIFKPASVSERTFTKADMVAAFMAGRDHEDVWGFAEDEVRFVNNLEDWFSKNYK